MASEWEQLLERNGWTVECEHPFEIRHEESGSFATMKAADMVLGLLIAEQNSEQKKRDRREARKFKREKRNG